MEFQYIDILFDSGGSVLYESIPNFINQYATNYKIRVGFTGITKYKKLSASIYTDHTLPERILFEDASESISVNGIVVSPVSTYQLSQFDTYRYVNELSITINTILESGTIFNASLLIPMKKANYSKITPAGLDEDSTLNALIEQMTAIRKDINEHLDKTGHGASASVNAEPDTLMLRDANGNSKIASPSDPAHVANKEYVDKVGNKTLVDTIFSVDEGFLINYQDSNLTLPMTGSEGVVVDISDNDEKIEIHLDNDIYTKLGRALLTPVSIPKEIQIVSIDNTGSQNMLTTDELYTMLHPESSVESYGTTVVSDNSVRAYFSSSLEAIIDKLTKVEAIINTAGFDITITSDIVGKQSAGTQKVLSGIAGLSSTLSCQYNRSTPTQLVFSLNGTDAPTSFTVNSLKLFYKA